MVGSWWKRWVDGLSRGSKRRVWTPARRTSSRVFLELLEDRTVPSVSFNQPPGSPFAVGTQPGVVATGDFNHDANLDLAIAGNGVKVLLGNGDGTFGAATNFPTGGGPYGVATGDFNNDGNLDLAVANNSGNNVGILLGDGTGSFAAPINISVGSLPIYVAVGDFNGDGRSDLAVTDGGTPHAISILLGNGDGTFQPAMNIAMDSYLAGIAVADFNHDGKLDLVVANVWPPPATPISVLLGRGDGTFDPPVNYPAVSQPNVVTLGDFNGDGNLDLAVSRRNPDSLSVLLGNGDGSFGAPQQFSTGTTPRGVAAADFNGDGKLDLVVANQDDNTVSVLLGNGDGTFGPPTNFGVGTNPYEIAVADFNHDGAPDVVIANNASNNVTILLNQTNQPPIADASGPYTVVQGGLVQLDASGTTDPDQSNTTLTYLWDLDGDGIYGETGAAAGNGDEVGIHPIYSAAGLNGPQTVTVGLRVIDNGGLTSTATASIFITNQPLLQADPMHPDQMMLVVGGSTGDDKIRIGTAEDDADSIKVRIKENDMGNVKIRGTFAVPLSRIVVYGQAGNDDIKVDNDITIPAWLFGGDGNDRLKGGNGPNVLVGGAGDDLLVGGNGRDILIGDIGADKLIGNGGDDILIGGYTSYDALDAALAAIAAEWNSNHDFAARVANISDQTSSVGFLSRLNGNCFLIQDVTVFNDSSKDTLTGSAGLDWFFAGTADKITDLSAAEQAFIFV